MFKSIILTIVPALLSNSSIWNHRIIHQKEKKNILILLADDAVLGDYSCEGNIMVKTPRIDSLAKVSIQFNRFYVCPVSAPTRAELLTGRFAYRGGVVGVTEGRERLDPKVPIMTNYLKKAGYKTGIFGKWHNGSQYPYHPNARGFDEFYGYCSGHWGNYWAPILEHNGKIVHGHGFLSDDLASHAMRFIEKNKKKAWFCYVPFNIPHSPMMVTDSWWNPWKNKKITQHATISKNEDIQHKRAALALIENLDWNVGRILDKLEALGLTKNTIIVYFSDNGPNGYRYCKGLKGIKASVDEGGVRSPLFIKWSGNKHPGAHSNQLASSVDIMPTLMNLSGAYEYFNYNEQFDLDGIDLSRQLKDTSYSVSRSIVSMWSDHYAIRKDSLLLKDNGEIYNIVKDPKQLYPLGYEDKELRKNLNNYSDNIIKIRQSTSSPYFTIGDPREKYVKLPARDGKPHGGIERSNKFPNCSYFTNWTNTDKDAITWQVNVLNKTKYKLILRYRCEPRLLGSIITLSTTYGGTDDALNNSKQTTLLKTWTVDKAFYKPMLGADLDRVPRQESYFPSFGIVKLGKILLNPGKQTLTLRATNIKGPEVMDVYMLELDR